MPCRNTGEQDDEGRPIYENLTGDDIGDLEVNVGDEVYLTLTDTQGKKWKAKEGDTVEAQTYENKNKKKCVGLKVLESQSVKKKTESLKEKYAREKAEQINSEEDLTPEEKKEIPDIKVFLEGGEKVTDIVSSLVDAVGVEEGRARKVVEFVQSTI